MYVDGVGRGRGKSFCCRSVWISKNVAIATDAHMNVLIIFAPNLLSH